MYIHMYIHTLLAIRTLQNYDLASHTTHVVYVNFIREWQQLQFNIGSERQLFEKLFRDNLIYYQSFCQKSAERTSPKIYLFFVLRFDI